MTDTEKATALYKEVCEYLDHIQAIVFETLSAGHELDNTKEYHISMAQGIIKDYEELPENTKEQFLELGDRVMTGELSIEDALTQAPYFPTQPNLEPVTNIKTKKPLLN